MATYTAATFSFDLSTDANYRALWGTVDTKIQALGGWTYDAQTGDSDPAAATTGSVSTWPSWRVYSTTVSGETWYMRLDYGHVTNGPSFKVQFGSTVNGSGVLGGQTSTQQTCSFNTGNTGAGSTIYIAQAAGRFLLWLGIATGNVNSINAMAVHGGVDGSGAMSSGLDWFTACSSVNQFRSQCVPVSGTVPAIIELWPCNFGIVADETIGSHIATGHPFLWVEGGARNPTPAVMLGGTTNSTAGLTTTATLYGSTRTFLASGDVGTAGPNLASTNNRALFLFE